MKNQLTRGLKQRLMYLENKAGLIDGCDARIGWATFSKTGRTVYYRGRTLCCIGGRGISGNFMDVASREEFWVSGIKKRGTNAHPARPIVVEIDSDARQAYRDLVAGG